MILRDYQADAVRDMRAAIEANRRPCLLAPTGSGKSLIGAALLDAMSTEAAGSALSVTHTRELIAQNVLAYERAYNGSAGVYSAGLGRKELNSPIVMAGVQSLVNVSQDAIDPRLILIDEAHRIPKDESSQYQQILHRWSGAAVAGLTATPYRLDQGAIVDGELFNVLIESVSTSDLVDRGYLAPLIGVEEKTQIDTEFVRERRGDFVTAELEQEACSQESVSRVCASIQAHSKASLRVLVFAVGVQHAELLADEMGGRAVHGGLSMDERDGVLGWFRSPGEDRRVLVNCMVLTTGFDQHDIDAIAVVRPTLSKGLFSQMIGRGSRVAEGKRNCLILDYGGNFIRHSPLDEIPKYRDDTGTIAERERQESIEAEADKKRYAFRLHRGMETTEWHALSVHGATYTSVANKKRPDIKQVVVRYTTDQGPVTLWVLPEHSGYPRSQAESWAARRGIIPCPYKADALMWQARKADVPSTIIARRENGFWRVRMEQFET